MNKCLHCVVEGRVQGVFFRASTQARAKQLGLSGFARNHVDGSVEILACGEEKALEQLCQWLKVGPSAAQVESVNCKENVLLTPDDFSIA